VRQGKRQRERERNRQKCRDRNRVRASKTEKYINRDSETRKETEIVK